MVLCTVHDFAERDGAADCRQIRSRFWTRTSSTDASRQATEVR